MRLRAVTCDTIRILRKEMHWGGVVQPAAACPHAGASPADPPRAPLELWAADADTGVARPLLLGYHLNTVFGE